MMAIADTSSLLVVREITTPGRSSLIGVAISLTGNVLISLALNCQKLAHLRLQREAQGLDPDHIVGDEDDDDEEGEHHDDEHADEHARLTSGASKRGSTGGYGSISDTAPTRSPLGPRSRNMSRSSSTRSSNGGDGIYEHEEAHSPPRKDSISTQFLRSRLWWLGFGLMSLGECGNFLSYGFAPASLVAPLGAVALLSNVIISPILLKERFRPSDIGGIVLAIIGAVTVVFSSKQNDATLDPDTLLKAILRTEFLVYTGISIAVAAVLAWASTTKWGDRYILLDVGVCALFGGFTVLSTKGVSSLLSMGRPLELLRYPIAYAMVLVLVGTALAQITYLNRALQRFDSREVIPTQFVTFTISAIVGSAILYQDFADVDVHRLINFLFGCSTTFAGVFVLTRRKNGARHSDADAERDGADEYEDAVEADEDGEEATLGGLSSPASAPPQLGASSATSKVALPVAVPRTHPAAANAARRGRRRLQARRSIVGFTSGSMPTVAVHRAPDGTILSSSLQETGGAGASMPVIVARRSIFNPAFTIAYLDQAPMPTSATSTPRRPAPAAQSHTQHPAPQR